MLQSDNSLSLNLDLPVSFEYDPHAQSETIGVLPFSTLAINGSQSVRELLSLMDHDTQAIGVLVLEKGDLIGLIPRKQLYEKLGRPYGVELFLKSSCKKFYELLCTSTLILSEKTSIEHAVAQALKRNDLTLYEPLVITSSQGYRVVSMYSLLMAQQEILGDLYTEVHRLSTKDPLTFVNNRRGFFDLTNQRMAFIREYNLEYAVLMIDVDDFKNVNDRYGHPVGDEVILSIARHITTHLRHDDVLGRFGGDEFVALLVDISEEDALKLAKKLCQSIASLFHTINGFQIRVTISIGLSCSKGYINTLDRVLNEADQAVYSAKSQGRNRVISWKMGYRQIAQKNETFRTERNLPDTHEEKHLEQILYGLLRMLYLRDYETEAHTMRVSKFALRLAMKAGVPSCQLEDIRVGSLLHDIGKIAIPDVILFKPGKFTEAEWAIMRKHSEHAFELLSQISCFQNALDIPYCHHEHWDGSGYPRNLKGEEIPLAARIFALVDVWDALTSDRPYRAAWQPADAKAYLIEQAGKLFDPRLVPLMIEVLNISTGELLPQ